MVINLQKEDNKTNIQDIISQLENDLIGLTPVKQRIKEIAALLLIQRLRKNLGLGMGAFFRRITHVIYWESWNRQNWNS